MGNANATFNKSVDQQTLEITLTADGKEIVADYFLPGVTWERATILDRTDPQFCPEIFDRGRAQDPYGPLEVFGELVDYEVANGWTWLDPNDFALTSNPYILSDDASYEDDGTLTVSTVYRYGPWELRDPIDDLVRKGAVAFDRVVLDDAK